MREFLPKMTHIQMELRSLQDKHSWMENVASLLLLFLYFDQMA